MKYLLCFLLLLGTVLAEKKPNFIIIMADDLGYGDLGSYGNKEIKTPHLDRLAKEGMRFTDFHSNGAVCSPTRAALLTGLYQHRTGISGVVTAKSHRHIGLSPKEKTFAEYFKELGYSTGIFGKWHVGYETKFNPVEQGFDEYIGFISGNIDFYSHIDQEGYEDWWNGKTQFKEEGYVTDLISKHSINFIKKHQDKPFLLYIPHEAPHYPIQGRNSKAERVAGKKAKKPHGKEKDKKKVYKEMIEILDQSIGDLLATLTELKLEQNTFIIFLSDNGATKYGSNSPLKGAKASVYEGGHRIPAIAYQPSLIQAGQVNDSQVMTMDILPTLLDLAGAQVPEKIDGVSFKSTLLKGETAVQRELFWEHKGHLAMRSKNWKLVMTAPKMKAELYDLSSDIGETTNLASQHPELVKELSDKVKNWLQEVTPK